jgi:hypothetical protein
MANCNIRTASPQGMVDDVRGRTVLRFQCPGVGAVDRLHLDVLPTFCPNFCCFTILLMFAPCASAVTVAANVPQYGFQVLPGSIR